MNRYFSVFLLAVLLTTPSSRTPSQIHQGVVRLPLHELSLSLLAATGFGRSFGETELRGFPYRERDEFLRLMPGIIEINGNIHFQGSRPYELRHYINGVGLTNRYLGTSELHVIPEALESFTLVGAATSAVAGFSTGAITLTRMRTGGDELRFRASILTDNLVKTGKEFLNTTSFGYRTSVLTAEGKIPIANGIRFFVAAENHFVRNKQAMFLDAFRYDSLRTDNWDTSPGRLVPGPVAFSKNFLPNNWFERNTGQGTLLYSNETWGLQLTGSYQHTATPIGAEWPSALVRIFNRPRIPTNNVRSGFLSLAGSYQISGSLNLDASATYYRRSAETHDPDFDTNWPLYIDSLANARRGYYGFRSRWEGPHAYRVINSFSLNDPRAPNNTFSKDEQTAWMGTFTLATRFNDNWHLTVGGELERWQLRRFTIGNISSLMSFLYGFDGNTPRSFSSEAALALAVTAYGGMNFYGFDPFGNPTSNGYAPAFSPTFASAFAETRYERDRVTLTAGLRFELYDTQLLILRDRTSWGYDPQLDAVAETSWTRQSAMAFALPRFSLTYTPDPNTSLCVAAGAFAQMPPLANLYASRATINRSLNTSMLAFQRTFVADARPERSRQLELALHRTLSKNVQLQTLAFYRSVSHQLSLQYIQAQYTRYIAYANDDESEVKGITMRLLLGDTTGFLAKVQYTLSDAKGTGSSPTTHLGRVRLREQPEAILRPLDYHQTHTVTALLSYRSGERDDFLSGFYGAAVIWYGSGHPYTRVAAPTFGGAANPWNNGVQALLDPRTAQPVEPVNSSTTPPTLTVDVSIGKEFSVGPLALELYALALNIFNTKTILNVYPTTGSANDDGWLGGEFGSELERLPLYGDFYRSINLKNRWAYMGVTGYDIYGKPRQIRLGLTLRL